MRFPLVASAAAIVAVAIAACSGGQQSNYIAPPSGAASAGTTGPLTLSQNAQLESAGTAGGVAGTLTFVGGSGTVSVASGATAPAGTTAVTPASRIRVAATSPTSPNVYYVTISSTAGATLNGLPAVALALSAPAIGTFQEAQFAKGTWANVPGATAATNPAGTAVQFPSTKTVVTVPAGGSVFLAFYQGNFPQPTPIGQLANNILADPGFETGTFGAFGATVNSTGWTQCTISSSAPGAPAPNRAFSTFTPTPGSTPGAVIDTAGTTIPQGTATPVPTQNTVIANSGTHAAVFGGVFSSFNLEDLRYNGLCQTVTVPAQPGMQMALLANGNDGTKFFNFEVDALNTSNQFLGNIYEDPNPITATSSGDASYRIVTVPSSSLTPFSGQTINLFVGVWVDGGSSTGSTLFSGYYLVDDFNLTATQ